MWPYSLTSVSIANRIGSLSSLPERTGDPGRSTSTSNGTVVRVRLTPSRPPRDARGPGGPPRRGVRLHVVGIPDRTSWQVGSFPTLLILALATGFFLYILCFPAVLFFLCVVVQWRSTFSCPGWCALGLHPWRLLVESGWNRADRRAVGESSPEWSNGTLLGTSMGWSTTSLSIIFSLNILKRSSLLWSYTVSVQS